MKLLGFKRQRLDQWREVLAEERKTASLWAIAWEILGALATFRLAGKWLWRDRMRTCRKCLIYNRSLRQCKLRGSTLGCGCYVPFLAVIRANRCWARLNVPDEPLGWRE